MTDAIRSNRPHSPAIDSASTAHTGRTADVASTATNPNAARRSPASARRPHDDFGPAAMRDRRLDRALGSSHTATRAETVIQQRIAVDARRLGNLGSIVARMESLPMGPSMETHRNDVPYAPPLDQAIRESQGELLGRTAARDVARSGLEHAAVETAVHAIEHTGVEALATGAGVLGASATVLSAGIMPGEFAVEALDAGDHRAGAAVQRQAWENQQGRVDGQIAQSRADGRDAMRAADIANTSEPITIDWQRFQTDGDYAQAALTEARSQMRSTHARMAGDRSLLSSAHQMSPQVQAMFPWLVGGPQS